MYLCIYVIMYLCNYVFAILIILTNYNKYVM